MAFGTYVRQLRSELSLSLRQAAQRVGVDPAYLSRVEAGKVPASPQLVASLAELFGRGEDELLLLTGRLPDSLRELVDREPYGAATALKNLAAMAVAERGEPYGRPLYAWEGIRAIEDGFPFEQVSEIAEIESWRKELYRPIYHVHKWWAQRLGSVFRAAILGAVAPKGSAVMDLFLQPVRLPGLVVFDPFMGSGTNVGEAHKLGCTAIGRDINPVAYRAVRTALGPMKQEEVRRLFSQLAGQVSRQLLDLYRSRDREGRPCDVLYYFWVKTVPCPECETPVDLFPVYVFARHAYPDRNARVQVVCPGCGAVFESNDHHRVATCPECGLDFDRQSGPAKRTTAVCPSCLHEFPIAKTIIATGTPPRHRLYGKLVLTQSREKQYLKASQEDLDAYSRAGDQLQELGLPLPRVLIPDGNNTRQILNYGYRYWHELFNDRQLLGLALLGKAIRDLPAGSARDALAVLFSGALEFNNMFASYKGEGTGAVRHMFSHHILKPERMPIEANIWGTPKSSGAFATLFHSRLIRALEYRSAPFEVAPEQAGERRNGRKVFGISPPMGADIVSAFPSGGLPAGSIYLSCGDSATTDLPSNSVDLIVTDPPFFDNVHYSELADFFFVWQELLFGGGQLGGPSTTRTSADVQDTNPLAFAEKLVRVFKECRRVLRDDGLLVFSYHHSRDDGWTSLARAVLGAGFSFVQTQPVKSEMSVAAPKAQSKDPIDIDVLLTCRKRQADQRVRRDPSEALQRAIVATHEKVARFNNVGRMLSRSDVKVMMLSQLLVEFSPDRSEEEVERNLAELLPSMPRLIEQVWMDQERSGHSRDAGRQIGMEPLPQLPLF